MRELEIELDSECDWDARSLGPLLERLRDLRQQQNDLAAVRELMPEAEQDRVGRCEPLKLAVAQLGRRIFEARTRAGDPNSALPPAARRAELDRLDAPLPRVGQAGAVSPSVTGLLLYSSRSA